MTVQGSGSPPVEIEFDQVTKIFDKDGAAKQPFCAVEDLSLQIYRGELVALLGKTGCGKSTMFNMIAGLLAPTRGRVLVSGKDPFREFEAFRGKVGIVFQSDRLLPWRSAIENVEVGPEILGMPRKERRELAHHWLTRLGLSGHEHDYPHALSGGMRQRVSIARAFATNANLLLCDEPFSALDEMTAQRLRDEFGSLVRENKKTAVFITHSINEALKLGDRILVLERPARIARDIAHCRGADLSEQERIRGQIREVLAA